MNKIECIDLSKSFFINSNEIDVLNNINLTIQKGQLVAICGQSGAGKSTLLQILASLDTPSSGLIKYDDNAIESIKNSNLSQLRAK